MSLRPDQPEVFGDFADGKTAVSHRAGLSLEPAGAPDRLRISLPAGKTLIWPLEDLRRLPDQAGRDLLALSLAGDPVSRLYVADTQVRAVISKTCRNLKRRPPMENRGRLLTWAAGAVASVALIIFVLVPLMANQLAEYLPPEGEKALGDATFEQIRVALNETGFDPVKICDSPTGVAALDQMQSRLNPYADLPYPIQVHVLDHDMVNAFALPGGHIILFRGLIDAAQAPEEVAAVFAHEIGHVVGRDPTRDALRSAGSIGVLGLLFGDFAGGTVVLFLANQLINASYSQQAEADADTYAHGLMSTAELSPAALGTMFQRLKDEYGDAEGIVAHFASHPQLAARIEASMQAAQGFTETRPVLDAGQWRALQEICGREVREQKPSPPAIPGTNKK